MKEAFIQYVWKYQLFDKSNLVCDSGESVDIINQGVENQNAGPDFSNARIRLDSTLWAGNVEIHRKASDWRAHRHQDDNAYDNIVLHVVLQNDKPVKRQDGTLIPTLVLQNRIHPTVILKWNQIESNRSWIPCGEQISLIPDLLLKQWLDRLLIEHMDYKSNFIADTFKWTNQDWNETFYITLAKSFGSRVNQLPFEFLARSAPMRIIRKIADRPKEIEALLFGQAGLLNKEYSDSYPRELKTLFNHLQIKHELRTGICHSWKFSRMRPINFPTVRIAQFAALIASNTELFSTILINPSIENIQQQFNIELSEYWDDHYHFGVKSGSTKKHIGQDFFHLLLINSVIPMLLFYASKMSNDLMLERTINLITKIPPENNKIIRSWKRAGLTPKNAGETQSLLHLKSKYCDKKRCLRCAVGHQLINNDVYFSVQTDG